MTRKDRFKQILETFPTPVHKYLKSIPQAGGMLLPANCRKIIKTLEISVEDLMLRLLPLAKLYSAAKISDFQVGAIARARIPEILDNTALFFGANIEFPEQPLNQTIHAEQSAVVNAWLRGAYRIETIAVTAAPCGYCRQFFNELEDCHNLTVILPKPHQTNGAIYSLSDLLPQAFGPQEMGFASGLMATPDRQPDDSLMWPSGDPLVLKALEAAIKAYAPYSHNLAGCAVQVDDGRIFTGRYVENAAFNPSLSPLHTALIRLRMDGFDSNHKIRRVVLAECKTAISQRTVCESLLGSVAPDVALEYFEAG